MGNTIIRVILGGALIIALFSAGWRIYRRLPGDNGRAASGKVSERAETELTIVLGLKPAADDPALQVALYPLDIQALQREFSTDPYSGRQFDDFLAERMRRESPVRVRLDKESRAIVRVAQGNWWIHAKLALANDESAEWRLPVTVSNQKQTVELTLENAYERTKKF